MYSVQTPITRVFPQAPPPLSPAPPTTDWSQRRVSTRPGLGLLRGALSHVEELLRGQIQNITARGHYCVLDFVL